MDDSASPAGAVEGGREAPRIRRAVLWFVLLTVGLSFGVYFAFLRAESRALLVPVVLVFVPTVVCIPLAAASGGRPGLRRLFGRAAGSLRWVLIGAAVGALMRVLVLAVGLILGRPVGIDLRAPGTWFVVFVTIPLAFFEELGWRRFALARLLGSRSPLEAALILGVPWSIIHLILVLPGMMSAGAPAIPQTLVLVALSVLLTWVYVRSGGNVLAVTLLHGVQNGLVVLNRGLPMAEATWLMLGVYLALAVIVVLADRRLFFSRRS